MDDFLKVWSVDIESELPDEHIKSQRPCKMLKAKILRVYRLPGNRHLAQNFLKSGEHGGAERLNGPIKARAKGSLKERRL